MPRNKDYLLVYDDGGAVAIEGYGNATANRIYTALTIKKGTLISDYEWGSNLHEVKKNLPSSILAARRHCESALSKIAELEQVKVEVNIENSLLTIEIQAQTDGKLLRNKLVV